MIMTYNEQTNVQMTDQELSEVSGGMAVLEVMFRELLRRLQGN